MPYLPDVIARGAAFQGLPGTVAGPAGVFTVDFRKGEPWPEYKPFRVILRQPAAPNELGPAGPPETGSDGAGPYLAVELAKADVVQVRLSSTLYEEDLSLLGVWSWRENAEKEELQAKRGEVWMLTPFQVLTLVHAVRQPLLTPEFVVPDVDRQVGQTFAVLADRLTFSRKSTAKIEVYASWEGTDRRKGPEPRPPDAAARRRGPSRSPWTIAAGPRLNLRCRVTSRSRASTTSTTPSTGRSPTRRSPPQPSPTTSRRPSA